MRRLLAFALLSSLLSPACACAPSPRGEGEGEGCAGWCWENPRPSGDYFSGLDTLFLFDIDSAGGETFAVGAFGRVARRTP